MINTSINLLMRPRLQFRLKRRSDRKENPLILIPGKIRRARTGNKISRFFRLIFEKAKIKKFLGANLTVLIFTSAFIARPTPVDFEPENNPVTTAPIVLSTEAGIQNPVSDVKITQSYHIFHAGIDFDGDTGDPVYPIMDGEVEEVAFSRWGYGNSVLIDHGNGTITLYAHLSKIEAEKGQKVSKSTKLGGLGSTGWSTGDHLHLEVYENGKRINPEEILPKN